MLLLERLFSQLALALAQVGTSEWGHESSVVEVKGQLGSFPPQGPVSATFDLR